MAAKGKREPKPQARPGTLVDLNLWDVLLGLMETAETPGHGPEPSGAPLAHAGGAERTEAGEEADVAVRKAGRGSRRERRRRSGSGSGR